MHYAHLNFCFVLTAAMRGLESGSASRNRRAQHTHNTLPTTIQLQQNTDCIRHQRNNNYTDRPIIVFHNTILSYVADRHTEHQGLRPWTPLGALPPDPRILALRARYFSLCATLLSTERQNEYS